MDSLAIELSSCMTMNPLFNWLLARPPIQMIRWRVIDKTIFGCNLTPLTYQRRWWERPDVPDIWSHSKEWSYSFDPSSVMTRSLYKHSEEWSHSFDLSGEKMRLLYKHSEEWSHLFDPSSEMIRSLYKHFEEWSHSFDPLNVMTRLLYKHISKSDLIYLIRWTW